MSLADGNLLAVHIVGLQYDICWEDKASSQDRMDRMLKAAAPPPGSLLVMPELGDVGFSRNLEAILDERSEAWATETARTYQCWLQHGWAEPSQQPGRAWNVMATIAPSGEVIDRYRKVFTFNPGGEHLCFDAGEDLHLVEINSTVVCPLLCYDLRFPELFRLAARAGAEVFTVSASWPAVRSAHWLALVRARAIENQAWLVGVNRTGSDPHLDYDGQSCIVSPLGEEVARLGCEAGLLEATLDLEQLRSWRRQLPALADIQPRLLGSLSIVRH